MVERALEKFGKPVYVLHEIVHNRHVVAELRSRGAVFVEELASVPKGCLVIFSAHGVSKSVVLEAEQRGLRFLDATCPLVSKVHSEASRHHKQGRLLILIGHSGHAEAIGTMGQLPSESSVLVETVADVHSLAVPQGHSLAYATQTTLSVEETAEVITALKRRFPDIRGPRREDICYATTNRQAAVQDIASRSDVFLVVGSENSSNAHSLVGVARRAGCSFCALVDCASAIAWEEIAHAQVVGLTAGASTPEYLVQEIIAAMQERFTFVVEQTGRFRKEDVFFRLPRVLEDSSTETLATS